MISAKPEEYCEEGKEWYTICKDVFDKGVTAAANAKSEATINARQRWFGQIIVGFTILHLILIARWSLYLGTLLTIVITAGAYYIFSNEEYR